jgi:hypothetical protein
VAQKRKPRVDCGCDVILHCCGDGKRAKLVQVGKRGRQ